MLPDTMVATALSSVTDATESMTVIVSTIVTEIAGLNNTVAIDVTDPPPALIVKVPTGRTVVIVSIGWISVTVRLRIFVRYK